MQSLIDTQLRILEADAGGISVVQTVPSASQVQVPWPVDTPCTSTAIRRVTGWDAPECRTTNTHSPQEDTLAFGTTQITGVLGVLLVGISVDLGRRLGQSLNREADVPGVRTSTTVTVCWVTVDIFLPVMRMPNVSLTDPSVASTFSNVSAKKALLAMVSSAWGLMELLARIRRRL